MDDLKHIDERSLIELLAALRREIFDHSDPDCAIQDLQVHRLELELQNRELRDAQQALEESRDRYADLYDFAPVAYATIDRSGQITQMNLTAAQLLGVERGVALNLLLTARVPPADGLALLDSLARVLATGEAQSIELTLDARPPRHRRDLRLQIRREGPHGSARAPTACRAVLLDITEVKRAQAVIQDQQRFLQSVVDGIADPIRVTGLEHQILLMNAAAQAATGDGGSSDGGPDSPRPAPEVLARGTVVKAIQRLLVPDGQTRWIEHIGAPLRGAVGETLGVVESSRDITEHVELAKRLQERERQLEQLVMHDGLTGLPNRALFTDRLGHAIRQAHRERHQAAVLFVDLDRFKAINDSLGHPTGDQVLKQAAERMRALVRENDTVARLGGDEFAIVLCALERGADAGLVAHKLVEAFKRPFAVDARPLFVTASIGISLYPADGDDADTLVRHADSAMYRAKDQGRDTFRFYTEDTTVRIFAQVSLEAALRKALLNDELELHYQPQLDLATGRIVGLEALIRWHHPTIGPVEPRRFIPLAESTGFIVPLDVWVIRTACSQMKAWQDQGLLTDAAVWVNLSNRDMQNASLAETIDGIVRRVGLKPSALGVEITETWIMADYESAAGTIRHLQAQGIEVAIDDFGTGYSSLAALQRLGVRALKIDQSFVVGLPRDEVGCAIARAIIALGEALRLKVIAEGVETQAHADFFKAEGCQVGQGYLYSRPLPAAALGTYVRGQG